MDYPAGAIPIAANRAGGTKVTAVGGARAVWHSTEGDSIAGAVSAYRSHGGWPHVTWDPDTGEIAGHLPASVSARSVENRSGGVETNRYGTVLQVEVVARAADPFTDRPMHGLDRILAWMRANGVPDGWPMGPPLAYGPDERRPGVSPAAYGLNNGQRDAGTWLARGGHYAHSQVPENDHGDPGRIDITKLSGSTSPQEDDDVKKILVHAPGSYEVFVSDGVTAEGPISPEHLAYLQAPIATALWLANKDVHEVPKKVLDEQRAFAQDSVGFLRRLFPKRSAGKD